ncbi:MAG: ATP-binding protein [Rhodospirillaceae bacterium]|nr:ATP-binding protein [Rhodospirillaceae bacterium]
MNPGQLNQGEEGTLTDHSPAKAPLSIRPYARLLTMLGEQLLKNERVALVELIKNSYDADARRVEVLFEEFSSDMTNMPGSRIVVRDDGCGMTLETVQRAWMNPATPTKFLAKRKGQRRTPEKKRVVQGEKGIGRFAVLKLAHRITVTTRVRGAELETVVWYDFTRFDDDFVEENGEEKEIFLDEVKIDWDERSPKSLPGAAHGTIIEMEALKGTWNERVIKQLCRDVANLTDPVSRLTHRQATDSFEIGIVCNGEERVVADAEQETLKSLIEDKAVFAIKGCFQNEGGIFRFNKGMGAEEINLYDERLTGLWIWRQRYLDPEVRRQAVKKQVYICGDFTFQFYIFDFARGVEGRYLLTQEEKNRLKDHRIYLYRDGVRVYPYGDPDDDWLNIDISRGIGRAGDFFSNDQVIGWIDITHEGNPRLRDKTNREGLIETGGAAEDFVFLIGTFLSHIKQGPFARYQQKQRQKNIAKSVREGAVAEHLRELKSSLASAGQAAQAREVAKVESIYEQERSFLTRRAEMTEDLAGVGLSVEMASHDIMLLMGRAQDIGIRLARNARKGSIEQVNQQADMLVGVLQQIVVGMRDVQSLFRSSRRRRQMLKVEPILDKIHGIYAGLLEKHEITYRKSAVGTSPLVAKTTDGVVMQVLINLFDNAAYWLETKAPTAPREICVTLDGDAGELVFADSGPGVDTDDRPYIFEAFFSGKGQAGRGLGLYIARQLLERQGYTIELADPRSAALGGATFVVRFVEDDGQ